jgi:hypothetical protein
VTDYKVSVARSARKSLQAIDRQVSRRIVARLESLAVNPRPPGCAKLEGGSRLWRIRRPQRPGRITVKICCTFQLKRLRGRYRIAA